MTLSQAQYPFQFHTRVSLIEMTGLKARTSGELLDILKTAPESVIYHHTHHFLKQHHFLSPEPPNDFAYWVTSALNEDRLGEELAAIDTVQFTSLITLRDKLVQVLTRDLARGKPQRTAPEGNEFHFMKSVSFILPTPFQVLNLSEFSEALKKITISSLYHHIFEARLRLGKETNDFSAWLDKELNEKMLASLIARLDPYTQTLESLRSRILWLVQERLQRQASPEVTHVL